MWDLKHKTSQLKKSVW